MNKNKNRKMKIWNGFYNTLPVSKYVSRKDWEHAYWKKLLLSKDLLELLITSNERHNIVIRAATLDLLNAGKSYRQISKELWVSLQTISITKKALAEKSYKSYLERSKRERKKMAYKPGTSFRADKRRQGIPRRTKYGTIYLP